MDLLSSYGLFLAKAVTVVVAFAAIVLIVLNAAMRKRHSGGQLRLTHLDDDYREMKEDLQLAKMKPQAQKVWLKQHKKEEKQKAKTEKRNAKAGVSEAAKPTLYVLEFKGSMDAGEVSSLREEISAVLAVAVPGDEVLLRLESPGGVVHGYGLAASQLQRLRDAGLQLTAVVDKVAASGGYMMACVADRIVAAPFSIIGSIGVVAQIPNFNRLLKRNDIDVELHTAGQYKRTLTLFGENTDEGREKFQEDLNETHLLFKEFVQQMRPTLDLEKVATGEHWYGRQALDLGLIDEIGTSDALIIKQMDRFNVLGVHYARKKKMMDRFTNSASLAAERLILKIWQRGDKPLL
ncbi:protease SohB [Pantoea sp. EABMAA-21]|jgi:serine protease SohB|uniref:protease SohB n=1 Tax=unclassified Pantoea TaxID=2630326 RepID=UPI000BD61BA5|nr:MULTISPECIES: protease SohB [unclassified Pantoea]MDF7630675.1 protease SohB [Erwiniaceae bacterium L1_55_4]MDI9275926.1 protease SohB [Pantoea sp. EABMAA-21]MXP53860.1 protease SohB [Pantoea sp. Seng]SNY56270.1 serine protease SohB [Pantoea sp. GL120224-02]